MKDRGFNLNTPLKIGLKKFVDWLRLYKGYV